MSDVPNVPFVPNDRFVPCAGAHMHIVRNDPFALAFEKLGTFWFDFSIGNSEFEKHSFF